MVEKDASIAPHIQSIGFLNRVSESKGSASGEARLGDEQCVSESKDAKVGVSPIHAHFIHSFLTQFKKVQGCLID